MQATKPSAGTMALPMLQQSLLKMVWQGDRRLLACGVVASWLNACATLLLLAQIKALITVDAQQGAAIPPVLPVWLIGGLLLLILLAHWLAAVCLSRLGAKALLQLRQQVSQAILAADYQHLERAGQGRIYAAFAEDLPQLGGAFSILPTVLLNVVVSVGAVVYLGWVSWPHLLLVLLLLGIGLLVSERLLLRGVKYHAGQFRDVMNHLYGHIGAMVYGNKEMKLNRQRRYFFQHNLLTPTLHRLRDTVVRRDAYASAYTAWSIVLSLLILSVVLLLGHTLMPMAAGTMVTYALVLLYLRGPVIAIINHVPHLVTATVALNKLRDLPLPAEPRQVVSDQTGRELLTGSEAGQSGPPAPAQLAARSEPPWREIELERVCYHYSGEDACDFALGPINLTLTAGEVVFITGGNGSGKSTLAKLIVGLYRPTQGTIRLDGDRVTAEHVDDLRRHMSTVFADYHLTPQVLGHAGRPMDAAWGEEQLQRFQMGEKVQLVDGCFSTVNVSQGQRKRLALINALAEDRPVLLLDEWAAEQDPAFRRYFYRQLVPALKAQGKTIIAITHDDQYFDVADRVIRMDQGRIITDDMFCDSVMMVGK